MSGATISEKILATKSGQQARAGDVVVCTADLVVGTDASAPMALDYFEAMGGDRVANPENVILALDHYVPPANKKTAGFHDRVQTFASRHGITVRRAGDGISHQLVAESGLALPGDLVVGADSHTVTCGALNAFATGVGSSDLAAAMICGKIWLKLPESIKVILTGAVPVGVVAKDMALIVVGKLGADGAMYQALEFHGSTVAGLSLEDRLVLSNMSVEAGAKAGLFAADQNTLDYLSGRTRRAYQPVVPDDDAHYSSELTVDVSVLSPTVAIPHQPDSVVPVHAVAGTPIQMVFLGTCTGGRVPDFHQAVAVLEAGGGVARGVQLVAIPASREVYLELLHDGTIARLATMGALIATPGCGPCCGTSGPVPGDGMNVISTANRNFKARMGNPTASIYLASPATCAAAAVTGEITDPRAIGH